MTGVNFFPDASVGGVTGDYDVLLGNVVMACAEIFRDGFESGDTSRWTASAP